MGAMNRRRFLQTTGAATVLAGSTLSLTGTAKAAPKRGGTLRVAKGHGSTTDTLDPGTWENGFVIAMGYGFNGYLTGVAPDGSVEPQLAESWEADSEAKVWRFKLRPGITFHSGKSVTPEDVIASINFHRGDDSTSAAKPLLASIDDITPTVTRLSSRCPPAAPISRSPSPTTTCRSFRPRTGPSTGSRATVPGLTS